MVDHFVAAEFKNADKDESGGLDFEESYRRLEPT